MFLTSADEERSGSAADDEEEEDGSKAGSEDEEEEGSGSGSGSGGGSDEEGSEEEGSEKDEEEEEEVKRPPPNKYLTILNTIRDINFDLDNLDRDVDRIYTKATARSSLKQRVEEPRRNYHSAMSREELKKSFSP